MMSLFRRWRRSRLLKKPFPREWDSIIRARVPYDRRLNPAQKRRLRDLVRIFIAEKYFEGCAGLKITDEIRVSIAAQACLLLLGRHSDDVYRGLSSVLVYPRVYSVHGKSIGPAGLVTVGEGMRSGESWNHATGWGGTVAGPVVLAWDQVVKGAADPRDGHNVVFHEFAHQLDGQSGGMEGAPPLDSKEQYAEWSRVMSAEFENLRRASAMGLPTLLNPYGATSPAEFFAVATEAYFERREELRERHPSLELALHQYFNGEP